MTTANEVVFLLDIDNTYPVADLTVERISDLINYDLPALLDFARASHSEKRLPCQPAPQQPLESRRQTRAVVSVRCLLDRFSLGRISVDDVGEGT